MNQWNPIPFLRDSDLNFGSSLFPFLPLCYLCFTNAKTDEWRNDTAYRPREAQRKSSFICCCLLFYELRINYICCNKWISTHSIHIDLIQNFEVVSNASTKKLFRISISYFVFSWISNKLYEYVHVISVNASYRL